MRTKIVSLLAVAFSLGFAQAASAADMPTKAPIVKAPVAAVHSWTGCYIGGFAGGAWDAGRTSASDVYAPPSPAGEGLASVLGIFGLLGSTVGNPGVYSTGPKAGFMGGGTLGCNYQMGWAVFGLEGEGGYLHMSSTNVVPGNTAIYGNPPFISGVFNTKVGNWYGLLAARFGYAMNNALFYVKGGAVWTSVNSTVGSVCNTTPATCGQDNINAAGNLTVAGWAVGGGLEYAFSRNWSAKAEALYLGFDKQYLACGPSTAFGGFQATQCSNEQLGRIMTVKVGLNYKFY